MSHKITLDYEGIEPFFIVERNYETATVGLPTFLTSTELETLRGHIESFEELYNLDLTGAPSFSLEGVKLYFHLIELGAPKEVAFRCMNAAGELGSIEAFNSIMEAGVPFVAIDHRGHFLSNVELIFTLQHYMTPQVANAIGVFTGSELNKLSPIVESVSRRSKRLSVQITLDTDSIFPLLALMRDGVSPDIAIWLTSIVKDWDAVADLERNMDRLKEDLVYNTALGLFDLSLRTRQALLVYVYSGLGSVAVKRTVEYLRDRGVPGNLASTRELLALMEYFSANEELGQASWAWLMSSLFDGPHESKAIS